jgi:hypothetical protein
MKRRQNKCSKKLDHCITDFDIFAKPVELTYKGLDKFKTFFGGLISLLVLIFILAMAFYKASILINRG